MDRTSRKYPDAVLLLRKSQRGHVPVLKGEDFPVRFAVEGAVYCIERTRAGKTIMKKETA